MARRARYAGVKVSVLGALAAWYIRLVHLTTRWTIDGEKSGRAAFAGPGGAIAVTWHGRVFMAPTYAPRGRRMAAMVSRSRDGALFASILRHWRIESIRGSSHDYAKRRTKGGAGAYKVALAELAGNRVLVGLTPDGPRGPRCEMRPGATRLACAARVPVIAVAFSVRWGVFLRTWDRFLLPLPFGRGAVIFGPPRQPPEVVDRAAVDHFSALIAADLNAVTAEADKRCGRSEASACGNKEHSPALAVYLAASRLAPPMARLLLAYRAARGREDRCRLHERRGLASVSRPPGRLIWMHGASVGEAKSILPLIAEFRRQSPDTSVLVTTGTVASAHTAAASLPDGCVHQYAPVDVAHWVKRFLQHWKPDLAIWVESEFWPRLMVETARAGVPMAVVNARISARSVSNWRRLPGMAARLVGLFRLVWAQDAQTVDRLAVLGADRARLISVGNLKALMAPPDCNLAELSRMRSLIGARPVWLAASTHSPEESVVAEAHKIAARRCPGLLTILAPRHPDRGGDIALSLRRAGLAVARRSADEDPTSETDVLLADTLGEMGLWLRLAQLCFVGGSLTQRGGHTPFEPAALGVAIVHGPDCSNFNSAYAELDAAGGARLESDAAGLGGTVADLLGDPEARSAMTEAARKVCRRQGPNLGAQVSALMALMGTGG